MRYRHLWPGLLLLGSLIASLIALIGWGDRVLSPGPSGGLSRLLEVWSAPRSAGERLSTKDRSGARLALPEPTARPADPSVIDTPEGPAILPAVVQERRSPRESAGIYALDFGTFLRADEAEQREAQLNQAGFSTVRFSRPDPGRLFSVSLPLPRDPVEARTLIDRLREDGFVDAKAIGGDAFAIRIVAGMPLRTAVRIAGRLRGAGHDPLVSVEARRAEQIGLRHGHFTSREEAESVKGELARLGVAAEVVRIP